MFNKVPDFIVLLQRQLIHQSVNRELIHNSLDVLMWLVSCQVFIYSLDCWWNKSSWFWPAWCFSASGKRGKKQRPGVVDISEIVSRIAPKVRNIKLAPLKLSGQLYICVVAAHDCVLIIDPVNSLLTLLLRCVSEARPARGYRADLTAVDRRQRHHSLHAWCSRAQTQEEIPEVGPEDPTQLSALGFYLHPHQKSVVELRVSAVVGLCNATLWLRGVCFHLHRPPARVLHV